MTTRHNRHGTGTVLFAAGTLLAGWPAGPAEAQQPVAAARPAAAPRLSAADRDEALKQVKTLLSAEYVIADMRARLVERLGRAEQEGRYRVDDPSAFGERITEDLRAVSHDGHLSFTYAPAAYAAAMAPPSSDRGSPARARRQATRAHHGLTELRVLPGNIRYLRITGFEWVTDETGAAYDAAMRFLSDGDAVIIDLRGNGGGAPEAVQYLTSHFLPPDTLLLTFVHGSETPIQSRTLGHLPAGRLRGKPLYVLIDGGVASAAEEFAYHVQQFRLGELVGARTAGGANNNRLAPIAPGFILSVSVGRPVHAVSGEQLGRRGDRTVGGGTAGASPGGGPVHGADPAGPVAGRGPGGPGRVRMGASGGGGAAPPGEHAAGGAAGPGGELWRGDGDVPRRRTLDGAAEPGDGAAGAVDGGRPLRGGRAGRAARSVHRKDAGAASPGGCRGSDVRQDLKQG